MSHPYFASLTEANARVLAGDHDDDDAEVFESQLEPAPNPPRVTVTDPVVQPARQPAPPHRLITGTELLSVARGTFQLLPPDPYRTFVNLYYYSDDGGSKKLLLADDPGKVDGLGWDASRNTLAMLLYHDNILTLPAYTGPLYVGATGGQGMLTWSAITR